VARAEAPSVKCALLSVSVVKPVKAAERAPSASLTADAITGQRWIRESELASLEELARENQGFVAVERGGNSSVAVNVYLPVAEQTEETSVLESGFHPNETVLLVEDESVIRTAVVEFLSSNGYNVLSATNLQEALDQILTHPGGIDLVVTYVITPQMSGPKLAEAAAAIRPDTKVLFVSGNRDHPGLNLGSADSAYNFLLKPFSLGGLGNKVREVLAQPAPSPQLRAVGAGAN
jgi:two-component system, cell cycle sensor histidine kinase and response regulator CckA